MTVIADVFEHCVFCETSLPRATSDSTGMTVIADVFEHCVYCETSLPRATSTCRCQQISLLWR
ncbi:hypothetical protein J6590_067802 [Homalodisca vitripennis]|nr:hypothetical protein J6590_067802 [Homalodisca vitripennis]